MADTEVVVRWDNAAVKALAGPGGPLGRELARRADRVLARAKQIAPVAKGHTPADNPPGYLREHLVLEAGQDTTSHYIDLITKAASAHGFRYGTLEELRRPHIRKAVTDLYGRQGA
jgi:hypothetical protein